MKKSLLLLSFAFGTLIASAQITITSADVAAVGKVIHQANDSTPTISIGTAGTNQYWDMSLLKISSTDTLNFISYGWAPDTNFTSSNLVMKQGTSSNYAYLNNSATGLTVLGNAGTQDFGNGPDTIHQINTPSEILMKFPATYNTTTSTLFYNNNFTTVTPPFYVGADPFGLGFNIDSVRSKSVQKKTVVIDAWGSLKTPLGTYNVIRSKETIVKHDTTDVMIFGAWNPFPGYTPRVTADSTTGYTWWANGVGFPLVSVKLDSLGALKQVQWLKALPLVGIEEYANETNVKVYPNPAQNQIVFDVDAAKVNSVEVFDITGRKMDTYHIENSTLEINTSKFANGAYSYTILGKNNTLLNHGKFMIAK